MTKPRTVVMLVSVVAGSIVAALAVADEPTKTGATTRLRVGVFDSRAVACAHFGRFIRDGGLERLYKEHNKAKAAGNTQRAEELAAEGVALQKQLHMRVFGSAPIDDILEKIKRDIPLIARDMGVDIVIGKWDIVYQTPSAQYLDITGRLVDLFEPDEETREKIESILEHDPFPAHAIENMKCEPPK